MSKNTCRVLSMANYLARKGRLGQTERRSARRTSSGAKGTDSGSDGPPRGSPAIIFFPAPRHPLPAA